MIKTIALVLLMVWLTVSAVSAQQPPGDTIDILYNDNTCRVSIEWEDGLDDTTLLEVAVGAAFRPDVPVNDFVGDQSQVLSSFTLEAQSGQQRIQASIYDGAELLDREVRFVRCQPEPVQQDQEPRDPRRVKTHEPEPDNPEVLLLCPDGRIIALRAGERCNFGFPQCFYGGYQPQGYFLPPCQGQPYSAPSPCGFSVCQPGTYSAPAPVCQTYCQAPQSQGTQFTSTQPQQQSAPVQQQQSVPQGTTYSQPSTSSAPTQQSVQPATTTTQSQGAITAPRTGDGGLLP